MLNIKDIIKDSTENIAKCTNIATHTGEGELLQQFIEKCYKCKSSITSTEFDNYIKKVPFCRMTDGGFYGWTALCIASKYGDYELVKHIINKYGRESIHIGTYFEWTPLFCACCCINKINAFETAKILIETGCDINLAITNTNTRPRQLFQLPGGNFFCYSRELGTPLYACLAKSNNILLAWLLIKSGAVVYNPEKEEIEIIKQIINMFFVLNIKNLLIK